MDDLLVTKDLMNLALFNGIEYQQIEQLREAAQRLDLEPGVTLCNPLSVDEDLYLLLGGRLRLESADGAKLADLEPVRIIGEMGVLTGLSRSSRVVVEEKADVLAISRALLQDLAENDPDVGARLLINLCKTLYERVFGMNGDIEKLHQRVDALATRLKELAPDDPLLSEG